MNKFTLALLVAFISQSIISQRAYNFDHMMAYTYQRSLKDPVRIEAVFINSKDNEYHLLLVNDGNPDFTFYFVDHKRGFQTRFYLEKSSFLKANKINLDCDLIKRIKTPSYNTKLAKKHFFKSLKDTIINDTVYNHIILKTKKVKRKKKRLETHYITYKDKKFEKPFIGNHLTYLVWKEIANKENFNFDIIKEQYSIKKGQKEWMYKFIELKKINNKYISIPEACDYTN